MNCSALQFLKKVLSNTDNFEYIEDWTNIFICEYTINTYYPNIYFIDFIYKNSKINISDICNSIMMMSYKTHNSIHDLNNLPFYMFNNYCIALKNIIEEENKNNEKNSSKEDVHNMMTKQMSTTKAMIPKFK